MIRSRIPDDRFEIVELPAPASEVPSKRGKNMNKDKNRLFYRT
jgi:hypothetical protein